jgi:pyruvate ferredoxin oxidoreductase gamma subunit
MAVIDATEIAVEIIGRPIPNTVILGAFTKATGLLKLESVFKAIDKKFPGRLAKGNKKAAQEGYSRVMIKEYSKNGPR